ncbi:MAG TPA: FecR domain-containing protein, partial [Polyangiaceae bacterium]|nr:FecR domain-containing protein [Polyangiaceae bacterium]
TSPRYARLVSELLARLTRAMVPDPPSAEVRARAITAIENALAARARRRRVTRWAGVAAACAAVLLATLGVVRHLAPRTSLVAGASPAPAAAAPRDGHDIQIVAHPVGGGASVVVSGAPAPLSDGRSLPAGSRVVTPPDGRARLAFSTGTSVAVGEGTDMTVADEGSTQLLRLDTGSIDLVVAKLAAGQRFIVRTPDSEVEVRGTQFRVAVVAPEASCGGGVRTRVVVTEGTVVVRHDAVETRLPAGEQWPAGCGRARGPVVASGPNARVASASTLTDQNNLFASALAAKRDGDVIEALAAFDRFLAKYPRSPLAESAYVERMRLERSVSSSRAASSARDYLAAYPNGFAHVEAEAIAQGTP